MLTAEIGWADADGGGFSSALLIRHGPSIRVFVAPRPSEAQVASSATPSESTLGLVDTGAEDSHIDIQLAERLGLPAIDTLPISGVSGVAEHPVFMAYVVVPDLELARYGRFAGVSLALGGQAHGMLLGRTFLAGVTMVYDGPSASVRLSRQRQDGEGSA